MKEDCKKFIERCIHCISGFPSSVPRPFGESLHASKANEIIHYDFLKINSKYILVIKDDLSHYVWLKITDSPTAEFTAKCLLEWYSFIGIPDIHVSDNGSHFKNKIISTLRKLMNTRHHFTHAYSPWTNGTVERVNREILTVLRALCSEFRVNYKEWELLVPVVNFVLNHSPLPWMVFRRLKLC